MCKCIREQVFAIVCFEKTISLYLIHITRTVTTFLILSIFIKSFKKLLLFTITTTKNNYYQQNYWVLFPIKSTHKFTQQDLSHNFKLSNKTTTKYGKMQPTDDNTFPSIKHQLSQCCATRYTVTSIIPQVLSFFVQPSC